MTKATKDEMKKLQDQFDEFDKQVKDMTVDNLNKAPLLDVEPQTKMAQVDIQKSKDIYLKPIRSIGSREKFNEKFRADYEFSTQMVQFIAENKEIIGEEIDLWTKPFPGMPAQEWKVPVNKPVWGPRHLAEKIKRSRYHILKMQQSTVTSADGMGSYYGSMVAEQTVNRLDAVPVSERKSIFMGAHNF